MSIDIVPEKMCICSSPGEMIIIKKSQLSLLDLHKF